MKYIQSGVMKALKPAHVSFSGGRKIPAARLFNLNLQLYIVVLTFLALFYTAPVNKPLYWSWHLAIVWGVFLLLQFVFVFVGRNKRRK
jgi:hypothetical protein